MRLRRPGAVVLVAALALAACTEGSELLDDPNRDSEPTETDAPPGSDGTELDPDEPDVDAPRLIDDECFGDVDRCGTILRPAGDGSDTLVGVYFSMTGADEAGRPLLILRSPAVGAALGDVFTDRPVVEIETRGGWRSPPEVDCPEARDVTSDATRAGVWEACRSRIAGGGFDVAATDLGSIAADVLAVADVLGFDEADLVASGFAAPAALHAAALAPDFAHRVVLHRPVDPTANAVARHHTNTEAALGAVWRACGSDDQCATTTDLDAFLDDVAGLDDEPIVLPPRHPEVDDAVVRIDAALLVGLLEYELESAAGARTVVAVPEWVATRSVEQLGRLYDDVPPANSSAVDLTWVCSTIDQPYEPPSHPLFGELIEASLGRAATICDTWLREPMAAAAFDPAAADVMTVVSTGDPFSPAGRADSSLFGTVVAAPSLGAPPTACLVSATESWLREGVVDDELECARPADFRPPGTSIELVDAAYSADWFDGEITLLVPAGWGDGAFGYWPRDRDTFDRTSLEVWLFEDTTIDEVAAWLPDEVEIVVDRPAELRVTDHAKWQVVEGSSTWAADERTIVAIAGFGDDVVQLVVRGDASEIDALISTVFDPVLQAVDYSG